LAKFIGSGGLEVRPSTIYVEPARAVKDGLAAGICRVCKVCKSFKICKICKILAGSPDFAARIEDSNSTIFQKKKVLGG